jgi:hypothetical protein
MSRRPDVISPRATPVTPEDDRAADNQSSNTHSRYLMITAGVAVACSRDNHGRSLQMHGIPHAQLKSAPPSAPRRRLSRESRRLRLQAYLRTLTNAVTIQLYNHPSHHAGGTGVAGEGACVPVTAAPCMASSSSIEKQLCLPQCWMAPPRRRLPHPPPRHRESGRAISVGLPFVKSVIPYTLPKCESSSTSFRCCSLFWERSLPSGRSVIPRRFSFLARSCRG